MAELTNLETKLGEVMGLAMAAQAATATVQKLLDGDSGLAATLKTMHQEASETEERCAEVAANFDGKKTTIAEEARTTKQKAAEMLKTYLDEDSDALDGFEFLTMAEAAEVGHWNVLKAMNQKAQDESITNLAEWALPIQQRHYADVSEGAKTLATQKDPTQPA